MFTFIITFDYFLCFLVKIKKEVFKKVKNIQCHFGFVCNIQMSYVSVVQGRLYFYFLT